MQTTSLSERIRMQELAECGYSHSQIASHLGCSRYTVRKWLRRYRVSGRSGLGSRMGRPRCGALSTFSTDIIRLLRQWRESHPGWGAKTLLTELKLSSLVAQQRLPSIRSIQLWLKAGDLCRPYRKRRPLEEIPIEVQEELKKIEFKIVK